MTEPEQSSKWIPVVVLLAVAVAALVLLTLVHLQLPYPFILDDEFRYSQLARFGRAPDSILGKFPVFLYLSTFSWVSRCGEGYLACGRFTNVLFLVASLLPLYRTARIFLDRRLALVIASFSIVAPASIYTAYFMAESMYFFLFWCLIWCVLGNLDRNPWRLGLGTGALCGLLTLVKPHGLFLLGAMAVFFVALTIIRRQTYPLIWLVKVLGATVLFFLTIRFGLGYLLAGREALEWTGAYRMHASVLTSLGGLLSLSRKLLRDTWGHAGGLVLIFPVPLAIALSQLRSLSRPKPHGPDRADCAELALMTVILFGVLIAIVVKFAVEVGQVSTMDRDRLSSRYYDFAFPLLLILTGAFIQKAEVSPRSVARTLLAVSLAAVTMKTVFVLRGMNLLFCDTPTLSWIVAYPRLMWVAVVLVFLLLAGWLFNARRAARVFLFGFFPLMAATMLHFNDKDTLLAYQGGVYEDTARAAKRLISPRHLSQGMVVGGDVVSPYRALFQIDSQTMRRLVLPEGTPIEPGRIPADRTWALIVGDHELHVPYAARIALNGARLVAFVPGLLAIDNQPWDGRLLRTTFDAGMPPGPGFHPFDGFCAWSRTTSPVIELPMDVSGDLLGKLFVYGYGPNANRTVQLSLGSGKVDVTLPAQPGEVEFRLRADGPAREIAVTGLLPASPAVVEGSPDRRELGMCLRWISIQADEKAAPALSRPGG